MRLLLALVLCLPVQAACGPGGEPYATVDSVEIGSRDVRELRRIEMLTGLELPGVHALLMAMERETTVALMRRRGAEPSRAELKARLGLMREGSRDKEALARAVKEAGEQAYLRWVVAPLLAQEWLRDHHERHRIESETPNARRMLEAARKAPTDFAGIAKARRVEHLRFELWPQDPVAHLPPGMRMGYEDSLRDHARGFRTDKPLPPTPPIDYIKGLGSYPRGRVMQLTNLVDPLPDGALVASFLYDGNEFLVLRRVAALRGGFAVEALRSRLTDFGGWLAGQYAEVSLRLCSPEHLAAVRKSAPQHVLVEHLK